MRRYENAVKKEVRWLEYIGNLSDTKQYIQHGDVSVYNHCVSVALCSCMIAKKLGIKVNMRSLIRGALLHDYFLYDWHEPSDEHRLHGFFHPAKAMENAVRDYGISDLEKKIILRHMFPLTVIPPTCREAWIVCIADKICATKEVYEGLVR